jgi:hypothetical protein
VDYSVTILMVRIPNKTRWKVSKIPERGCAIITLNLIMRQSISWGLVQE